MRILYVWARNNGVLRQSGVNLDTQYGFEFEEHDDTSPVIGTLRLSYHDKTHNAEFLCNSLDGAVQNISYTTAIVGNNGVGKTTLLRLLQDLNESAHKDRLVDRYGAVFIVYLTDSREQKYVYLGRYSTKETIQVIDFLSPAGREEFVTDYFEITSRIARTDRTAFLYYSNQFANEVDSINEDFDISTMGLLQDKKKGVFWNEELERQFRFMQAASESKPMPLPFLDSFIRQTKENHNKVMTISKVKLKGLDREMRRTRRSNEERKQDIYIWFVNALNNANCRSLSDHIMRCCLIHDLCAMTRYYDESNLEEREHRFQVVSRMIHRLLCEQKLDIRAGMLPETCLMHIMEIQQDNGALQAIYDYIERSHYRTANAAHFNNAKLYERPTEELQNAYRLESVLACVAGMLDDPHALRVLLEMCQELKILTRQTDDFLAAIHLLWDRESADTEIGLPLADAEALHQVYSEYIEEIPFEFQFLLFQWKMSAGEAAVLNFYARLYDKKRALEAYSSVVLLLDEPDVNLHPSLQQEYMKGLYRFLNNFYEDKNVYIIFATHSPLLLSDIPKRNIIFIKRDDEGNCRILQKHSEEYEQIPETFGANIISLYCNSFFLNEGSIGLFSKDMMQYVFDRINGNKSFLHQQLEDLIEIFGEPLLKEHAKKKLSRLKN